MSFFSMPYIPLRPRATEQQLEAIYAAAKFGLVGDQLAHAANMRPFDYARLRELDPMVETAEAKGRADSEFEASQALHAWAQSGDKAAVKASIAILQNKHGWFAKQQVDVNVDERISVSVALERAKTRLIEAEYTEVIEDKRTPAQKAADRLAAIEHEEDEA